jgi:hypothetical protein
MSGSIAWALSYELAPIVFCGGIAQNLPGGVMPITSITESDSFPQGIFNNGGPLDINDYFAHFVPLPGGTLGENDIGKYPFANQAVAGNAIIAQPLVISALMICPVQDRGWAAKSATMAALKGAFDQHDSLGGTYTYITPAFFYTNLVRLRMVDVSTASSKQPQTAYQLDFYRPLLTFEAAQQAQNTLMNKMSNGTQIQGQPSYSGAPANVGQPSSLGGSTIPSGSSSAGTNTAPLPIPPTPPASGFGAELT